MASLWFETASITKLKYREKLTKHHESLQHSSPFSLSSFACPRPGGHLVRILKGPSIPALLGCFCLPTNALVSFGTQFPHRGDRCATAVVRHTWKVYKRSSCIWTLHSEKVNCSHLPRSCFWTSLQLWSDIREIFVVLKECFGISCPAICPKDFTDDSQAFTSICYWAKTFIPSASCEVPLCIFSAAEPVLMWKNKQCGKQLKIQVFKSSHAEFPLCTYS